MLARTGTVQGDLVDVAVSLLQSPAFAVAGIIHARPSLMAEGWTVDSIEPSTIEITVEPGEVQAWLVAETRV